MKLDEVDDLDWKEKTGAYEKYECNEPEHKSQNWGMLTYRKRTGKGHEKVVF